MKNPRAYQSYFGGKSGNGTYQTIINHVPPHSTRYSLFAGNDALTIHMEHSMRIKLIDKDFDVVEAWRKATNGYEIYVEQGDALQWLDNLKDRVYTDVKYHAAPANTFIFLDPPYLLDTRKNQKPVYRHEMTKEQHVEMLEIVTQQEMQEYMIMICCYPNELYHSCLAGWQYVDYYSTIRGGVALERIYMNYKLNGKLHDYRYIGGDFRQRERIKRISTNLLKKLAAMPAQHRNAVISEIVKSLNEL